MTYRPEGKSLRRFVILVLLVAFFAASFRFSPVFLKKNTLSEGVIGIYNINNLPGAVANLVSEPLVKIDKAGVPQPNLAESWQSSDDSKIYTFKLRDGLYWNDGSKLKSSDIKFSLPDVEVSYPNDQAIVFKLADSFSPFPSLLSAPVFKEGTLIGVGRYKVGNFELSRGIITKLELSPLPANASLPGLVIRFYPDEKIARTAFDLGEVESLIGVTDISGYGGLSSTVVKKVPLINKITAIFYNVKDPVLSDKNMRKALGCVVPQSYKESIKTSIPVTSWAYNDSVKGCIGDPFSAKGYLAKVNSGKDSTITLTVTPSLAQVGEKVIQAWKESGISAVMRVESGIPQNFQALLMAQSIPSDPDQYALWHSTQEKTNVSRYSSPRVDKDLEDGRKTGDMEKRKEKYLDFQRVLAEDAPATFLYFPNTGVVYRKKAEVSLNKVINLQLPQL